MSETKRCERCRALPNGPMGLHDYCATCSRDLCDPCMLVGCCGSVPAISGLDADFSEPEPPTEDDAYHV